MNHATQPTIQTDSGASIRGDVTIENGNLIGRDQYNIYVGTPEQASRSQDQQAVQRALYEGTFTRLAFEPETVLIPAGEFLMGSNHGEPTERPSHPVALPDFRMGKYPVTNREYEAFTQSTGRIVPPELGWAGQIPPSVQYNHPVMGVTFQEAVAYAAWLSQESGRSYCVPAEAHLAALIAGVVIRGVTSGRLNGVITTATRRRLWINLGHKTSGVAMTWWAMSESGPARCGANGCEWQMNAIAIPGRMMPAMISMPTTKFAESGGAVVMPIRATFFAVPPEVINCQPAEACPINGSASV